VVLFQQNKQAFHNAVFTKQ